MITMQTPQRFGGPLPAACDVVVIGGGVMGVSTALELAGYGFVLDRGRVTKHGPAKDLLNDAAVREAYLGAATAA
jgi:glycine/D-amino acid oxidase-like deaminating enzyme